MSGASFQLAILLMGKLETCPDFSMKRYLITGASRGIGRAIAEELASVDVTLLLHGRDPVALEETRKAVESRCAEVVILKHDHRGHGQRARTDRGNRIRRHRSSG